MDEEARWHRHHAAITRAHELLGKADATLDECAIRDARRADDQPDALVMWASSMPAKPEPTKKQEDSRVSGSDLRLMALRADVEKHKRQAAQFRREVRDYREALEKAIGRVVGEQRKEIEALREQVTDLHREPIDLPPLKLIGGRRE
jgi:hypothetical protein